MGELLFYNLTAEPGTPVKGTRAKINVGPVDPSSIQGRKKREPYMEIHNDSSRSSFM